MRTFAYGLRYLSICSFNRSRIITLLLITGFILLTATGFTQKKYFRTSGEYIFGFSEVTEDNKPVDTKMRFSFFFHLGEYFHYDINNRIGLYTGLGIRNVGFITNQGDALTKRRSYNAGMPLGVKIGNLSNNAFLFAGGEYEYLFHYKEKTMINEGKSIQKGWTSDKTNRFLPSLFAGIQFKSGINVKFKYYLQDFMNRHYTETINDEIIQPYKNLKSQLFYISLTFNFNKYKIKDIKKLNPLKKEPKTIEV